jgi:hypothetical protein
LSQGFLNGTFFEIPRVEGNVTITGADLLRGVGVEDWVKDCYSRSDKWLSEIKKFD